MKFLLKSFAVILFITQAALAYSAPLADPTGLLLSYFMQSNQQVAQKWGAKIAKSPIITQDFSAMTLFKSSGERERFEMDTTVYQTLAEVSHPPVVVHNILSASDWEVTDSVETQLNEYKALLIAAGEAYESFDSLSSTQKTNLRMIFSRTNRFIDETIAQDSTSLEKYRRYVEAIQPKLDSNICDSTVDLFNQFNQTLLKWKEESPEEKWDELRVAIMSLHGPRKDYAQTQFFKWLLNDPSYEKHVVYVEFPDAQSILGDNHEKAIAQALKTLTITDYQQHIGLHMADDPAYMQTDVTAEAAAEILEQRGPSNWPSP